MSDMTLKDGLTAMEVASYLRRHPEFLNEFPDLALLVSGVLLLEKHWHNDSTVDLPAWLQYAEFQTSLQQFGDA